MAHVDGKTNVRVKLLDVAQVLACLGADIGGCVKICLTPAQIQKLKEKGLWFEEANAVEHFDLVLKQNKKPVPSYCTKLSLVQN